MLSDDELGALREDNSQPLNQRYLDAFQKIERAPNNAFFVYEGVGRVIGMIQLTSIPYFIYVGS